MRKSLVLIILFVAFKANAQDNTIKGQINTEIYANTPFSTASFSYYGNVAYRIWKPLDIGLNYGNYFPEYGSGNVLGIDIRFYILPYFYKKPLKTNLYIKTSWQYAWGKGVYPNLSPNVIKSSENLYSIYLGFRLYPLNRLGFMVESGYTSYSQLNANFGLTFKLKK